MSVHGTLSIMQTKVHTPPQRRRLRLRLVALLAAVAAVAAACGGSEREDAAAETGSGMVLDASVLTGEATTISGESVDLAALADQDLVVWFWAPW